jgi:hypothetical protein
LEAAKNGDEDAMESLTIEDLDLYSMASRRATREDIYSIVDTTFMPSGIECDQYSILGEIKEVICKKNRFTGEEIYDLKVECNDLYFRVGINKMDLLGEPLPGRRFKNMDDGNGSFCVKVYKKSSVPKVPTREQLHRNCIRSM